MSRVIYKYALPGAPNEYGAFVVEMPQAAKPLHVNVQNGQRVVWAEVYPGNTPRQHKIIVVGTGKEPPIAKRYLNTFFEGPFVWHVYDGGEQPA